LVTMCEMRVSVKADYAVRAADRAAAHGPGTVSAEAHRRIQNIPLKSSRTSLPTQEEGWSSATGGGGRF